MAVARADKIIDIDQVEGWRVLRNFDSGGKILPVLSSCETQGDGVGAERLCFTTDGGFMRERLEARDENAHRIEYTMLSTSLPFSSYRAVVQISEAGERKAQVRWEAVFDVEQDTDEEDMVRVLEDIFIQGINGLEKLVRQSNKQ